MRFAFRGLMRRPGVAALAVLTCGLGIGSASAMFSVLDGVLLRPLPWPDAERVMAIYPTIEEWRTSAELRDSWNRARFSPPEFAEWACTVRSVRGAGASRRSGREAGCHHSSRLRVIANQLSSAMGWIRTPGDVLRGARLRAGLSQRELARRARTAQSLVARIEGGLTSPTAETLGRLIEAAGYDIEVEVHPAAVQTHMLDDVPRILRLTPEERLSEVGNVSRFVTAARRV